MTQIAFEPTFDPFHAAFRLLRQTAFLAGNAITVRRMKVIDIYVAEPRRCLEIRLSGSLKRSARQAAACQQPTYGRPPSTTVLFNRMSPMQDAAIQTLVLHGLLDGDAFVQGQALRTETPLPDGLEMRIAKANNTQHSLMDFLCNDLSSIPFDGLKGLKDRTGIGEYRYDVI